MLKLLLSDMGCSKAPNSACQGRTRVAASVENAGSPAERGASGSWKCRSKVPTPVPSSEMRSESADSLQNPQACADFGHGAMARIFRVALDFDFELLLVDADDLDRQKASEIPHYAQEVLRMQNCSDCEQAGPRSLPIREI